MDEEELPLVEILPERSEEVAQRVLVVSKEAAAQGRIVQVQDVLPGRAGECHVVRLIAPTLPRLRRKRVEALIGYLSERPGFRLSLKA